MSKNIVVLISGRGSNFKAVYERSVQENWPEKYGVRISGVISNRPEAGGLTFAKENNIPFTSVAFNRILMAKGVIHEATRPSRDKNKPWKWKVLNKGFECFGQNIQDPNFQSQTQIKWYDNRFRDLLEFVGIEIPQTLGF